MDTKRFKPKIDKMFFWITIPTAVLLVGMTVGFAFLSPLSVLFVMIPTDLFTFYFLISPLFGYAELREESVFIKFGFIMKREIPYSKIRGMSFERKFYADSMLSLKNSLDHVNVKYNTFDLVSISVNENEEFVTELLKRCPK